MRLYASIGLGFTPRPPVRSADFNGNQYLYNLSPDSAVQVGTGDFWVACWARFDAYGSNRGIIRKGEGNSSMDYQLFYVSSGSKIRWRISDNTGSGTTVDVNPPSMGQWAFLWGHYKASTSNIYVSVNNGSPVSTTFSGTPRSTAERLAVGALYKFDVGNEYADRMDGLIDELAIGKGADLDTAAIRAALYNGGAGLRYADLTDAQKSDWGVSAWWTLDEVSGTRLDAHGSNHLSDGASVGWGPPAPTP